MQVTLAALGYAIFGVGVEIAGITVSKIIVKCMEYAALIRRPEEVCQRNGKHHGQSRSNTRGRHLLHWMRKDWNQKNLSA